MMKITPEELIRYMYNETSEQKSNAIRTALQTDWDLRNTYEELVSAQSGLNQTKHSPRPETINSILEYAAKRHIPVSSR